MLNLKVALAADITAGITTAMKAGALPEISTLPPVVVEHPEDGTHGEYASPVALLLTREMRRPPLDIVAAIVEHMPKKEYVGKIEAASPGFLNIRLNPGWMTARLDDILEHDLQENCAVGAGKRVNLEFISANPVGPLTLGNVRTAFSVDTLADVLTFAGYNVTREYYINDAGGQVAKLGESVLRRILQAQGESVEFPDTLYQGDYIAELGRTIAEEWRENEGKEFEVADLTNTEVLAHVSQRATALMLAAIKKTVAEDLKISFDVWTSEQQLRASGLVEQVVEQLRADGHTYTKDGAEYLKTTDYGDDVDRVLVKGDGEYAYIAPDIAYHHDKFTRGYDYIFTFVGADHQGHAPKLTAAMQALGHDVKRLHIVAAQWMRFVQSGKLIKLSKRRGAIVTPRELIAEVGYDAARFFMVARQLSSHLDFDLDVAREQSERNPVYYIQYAYVRLQSLLRRAKQEGLIGAIGEEIVLTSRGQLTQTTELGLMRELYRFPEVVVESAESFTAHGLCYYAMNLARSVHVFYNAVPVLTTEDQALLASRLQLVLATRTVLGTTLDLLGMNKPDVM